MSPWAPRSSVAGIPETCLPEAEPWLPVAVDRGPVEDAARLDRMAGILLLVVQMQAIQKQVQADPTIFRREGMRGIEMHGCLRERALRLQQKGQIIKCRYGPGFAPPRRS